MRKLGSIAASLMAGCLHCLASAQAGAGVVLPDLGKLLQGPGFDAEVQRQQQRNAGVATSLPTTGAPTARPTIAPNPAATAPASWLATVNQRGSELRYGNHTVVSKEGEKTVWLIRSLATAAAEQRPPLMQELRLRIDARQPEALNFMGFATENGLFGVTRDAGRAMSFYRAAASAGYQPAIYNLALASAYGRGSRDARSNLEQAAALLDRAAAIAPDLSGRVCGMGAFVNFRRRAHAAAVRLAAGCGSPLAALPRELADNTPLTPQRLEALRRATATGVDDVYAALEQVTRRDAQTDPQYLFCKYALLNRYRAPVPAGLMRDAAGRCYDSIDQARRSSAAGHGVSGTVQTSRREQVIDGIANFVPGERIALEAQRSSNHFHYGWSVPYLPFSQAEVDIFEPLIAAATTGVSVAKTTTTEGQ